WPGQVLGGVQVQMQIFTAALAVNDVEFLAYRVGRRFRRMLLSRSGARRSRTSRSGGGRRVTPGRPVAQGRTAEGRYPGDQGQATQQGGGKGHRHSSF